MNWVYLAVITGVLIGLVLEMRRHRKMLNKLAKYITNVEKQLLERDN